MENNNTAVATHVANDVSNFLQSLIDSKKLPEHVKTVADAFTIQQMGKELGVPTLQALHQIIPIKGKLSLSTRLQNALLRKGGISFFTKEDGVYVYADGSVSKLSTKSADNVVIKPVDRRTTIVFTRPGTNGAQMVEEVDFTWSDATKMGLTDKDNWKKMPREMLYARCLSKGANRIGADVTLGLYTTDELLDHLGNGLKAKRDEEGIITDIEEVV